jgi:hypothetical protein
MFAKEADKLIRKEDSVGIHIRNRRASKGLVLLTPGGCTRHSMVISNTICLEFEDNECVG